LHRLQSFNLLLVSVALGGGALFLLAASFLLFLADAAHLDLGTAVVILLLLLGFFLHIVLFHEFSGFVVEGAVGLVIVVLELLLLLDVLLHHHLIVVFVFLLAFMHNLLSLAFLLFLLSALFISSVALLPLLILLIVHAAESLLFFLLLAFRFFLTQLFLFRSFLLPLFLCFLLRKLLLALLLSNQSLLSCFILVVTRTVFFFIACDTKHLHDVGCGVDTSSGCAEHLLEEEVSVFGLVACNNFSGFAIDLFTNY